MKAIEVAPSVSYQINVGRARIDTPEGASKYFKERFAIFVKK